MTVLHRYSRSGRSRSVRRFALRASRAKNARLLIPRQYPLRHPHKRTREQNISGAAEREAVERPILCITAPFCCNERWQESKTFRTRNPSRPSVSGAFRETMQSKKCWHSTFKGSSVPRATVSPLRLDRDRQTVFSIPLCARYRISLSCAVSSNTAIFSVSRPQRVVAL